MNYDILIPNAAGGNKDAIIDTGVSEAYYAFRNRAFREIDREWCENHGIPYQVDSVEKEGCIKMATQPIYQFYSELADYEPKIWRRFQVPRNITMAKLGYILMTMYEMQASHLFCIELPVYEELTLRYELPSGEDDFEDGVRVHDASDAILGRQFSNPGATLKMQYDYGDGWEVALTLEEILYDENLPGRELPRVLDGAGYGIIEDCGGPGGLESLALAFQQKFGQDYEMYREWLGRDEFDLSAFDRDDINFRLKKIPRIYRDIYEYGCAPTERSLRILERDYLK